MTPSCEAQFRYTLRGQIKPEPSDNAPAISAIQNLNLMAERLRRLREVLINKGYGDLEALTQKDWLAQYVERLEGCFPEFAAMIRWFFDNGWRDEQRALANLDK